MTNEEAIRTLRNAAWFIAGSFSSIADSAAGEKIEKAVDMAVKALKTQEQLANNSPELANNFGDLISRNAAIDLWEKYHPTIAVDAMQYDAELRQLPSAHPEVRTQMSSADCISRQDAIDAADRTDYTGLAIEDVKKVTDEVVKEIKKLPSAQPEPCDDAVSRHRLLNDLEELTTAWEKYPVMAEQIKGVEVAIGYVKSIPSVQPETHEERTETHACDLISRQAAIDAECEVCQIAPKKERGHNCIYYVHGCKEIECLRVLPSAQPEIIRCKDCENWIPGYITDNDDFIPPKCGKYQQMVGHNSDDYCSFAERRTDDGD